MQLINCLSISTWSGLGLRVGWTVSAVFILRKFAGEFKFKYKKVFLLFFDYEKAFDQVPIEVIHFVLKRKGVPEYMEKEVMSLSQSFKTAVSVEGE